jgi:hypothetical protein
MGLERTFVLVLVMVCADDGGAFRHHHASSSNCKWEFGSEKKWKKKQHTKRLGDSLPCRRLETCRASSLVLLYLLCSCRSDLPVDASNNTVSVMNNRHRCSEKEKRKKKYPTLETCPVSSLSAHWQLLLHRFKLSKCTRRISKPSVLGVGC